MKGLAMLRREGRATVVLAIPLIVGQVAQMLMMVTDTVMIGRLGVVPLAASTLANTLLHLPFMFGIGMSIAVSIRVSQARGSHDHAGAASALRHGFFIGLGLGLGTFLFALGLLPWLSRMGQRAEVVEAVPGYFLLVGVSMVPAMASLAVKNHADAMNRPWPAFWILLAGVLLNVLLNWLLIFGKWGAPEMGLEGAGWATLWARVATLAGLLYWSGKSPSLRGWVPTRWLRRPDWEAVRSLVRVGLPASLQILAEVSAFVGATLAIGKLGAEALASHQVAISCVATVFMVPLGVSMALTVRVGEAWGAGEDWRLRSIALSGWVMALAVAGLSVPAFLVFNREIAGWFLAEPEALKITAGLLVVAAAFQIGDSMQVVSAGFLRGLDDVRVPAWISFLAYWGLALPQGWVLSFEFGMGVSGMWWGITVGLTFTAVVLGLRVWGKSRSEVRDAVL